MKLHHTIFTCLPVLFLLLTAKTVFGADVKTLSGHVPPESKLLAAKGDLPPTNEMRLALGVPVRDAAGLEKFLQQVTDPRSRNFRQYLTPEEFTARFGPTENDYAAVKNFARAHGLKITGEHGNRLVLDVSGKVEDVQRAFSLKLHRFKHPTEAREFFAPDAEPTVAATLPLADVSGLSNFKMPHPKLVRPKNVSAHAVARSGSAPNGDYLGNDFRKAYAPGTTLTGAGQIVGLLQFDSFYPRDIAAYQAAAGLPNIPVQTVLIGGYDGTPGSGNGEVALDIELAMAMAPGLSKVICFSAGIGGFPNDVLSAMVANNTVKQFSCSWGWSGGPSTTTDNLFRQMAAQGQSFYNASGDTDAFTPGLNSANSVDSANQQNAPSSSPYITQVGGTLLNTSGGAWSSETVWTWNDGATGSSGGISDYYAIPSWQAGTSMAKNKGSSTRRNIPDVAMVADYVYFYSDNGQAGSVSGTSCSAPLWAGFTALINQQAAASGRPSVGLINAAIYTLGNSANYAATLHDVTVGDNTSLASPSSFFATAGFDLCTGWGTPAGQKLIDALVGLADTLQFSSDSGFTASGVKGGAFSPQPATITLANTGDFPVTCALLNSNAVSWLKISPFKGTLAPGDTTNLTVSFTAATSNLAAGTFTANYKFTNLTVHASQTVPFKFTMLPALSATPTKGFVANGAVGGPFDISSQDFTILNRSATTNVWKAARLATRLASWISIIPTNAGVVDGNFGTASFTVALNTNANRLAAGTFTTSVYLYNQLNQLVQTIPFTVRVGQNIVSNGGFETGDFRGWTLDASTTRVTNRTGYVHSGLRGAQLGQEFSPGYLSQTLPTLAGQTYQLSLWLANPRNTLGAAPNEFSVLWEGSTIYDRTDLPFTNWFNLQFIVTATGNGSQLQFGFRDDPFYLGLDDVTLKPVPPPKVTAIVQKLVTAPPGKNLAAFNFTFAVTAGYAYQIQCKTNLSSPDWIDFGAPINATNGALNFSDTNIAGFPQKFYRLKLVP